VQHKEMTVTQVKDALGVKHPQTARKIMTTLDRLGIVTYEQPGVGKAAFIHFTPEWEWCLIGQYQVLFGGQSIDNTEKEHNLSKIGGCEEEVEVDTLSQNNLKKQYNFINNIKYLENSNEMSDLEAYEIMERLSSHPPKNDRLGKSCGKPQTYTPKNTYHRLSGMTGQHKRQTYGSLYRELVKMSHKKPWARG
jgi:hypothetical protein